MKNRLLIVFWTQLADRTGLEPATSAVTGRHSNQLNYRSVFPFRILTSVSGLQI